MKRILLLFPISPLCRICKSIFFISGNKGMGTTSLEYELIVDTTIESERIIGYST